MTWQDQWDEKCREADRLLQQARTNLDKIRDCLEECESMALFLPKTDHNLITKKSLLH